MLNDDMMTVKTSADYLKVVGKTACLFASEVKAPGFKVGSARQFWKSEAHLCRASKVGAMRKRKI